MSLNHATRPTPVRAESASFPYEFCEESVLSSPMSATANGDVGVVAPTTPFGDLRPSILPTGDKVANGLALTDGILVSIVGTRLGVRGGWNRIVGVVFGDRDGLLYRRIKLRGLCDRVVSARRDVTNGDAVGPDPVTVRDRRGTSSGVRRIDG